MKQITRNALAGIVLLGGITVVAGCQKSGSTDTTSRSSTPSGDATMTTGRFDMTYEATRDTEWVSSTAADAERGQLRAGDRVMLDRAPGTADWQEARTTTGRTVYIRPTDFRKM